MNEKDLSPDVLREGARLWREYTEARTAYDAADSFKDRRLAVYRYDETAEAAREWLHKNGSALFAMAARAADYDRFTNAMLSARRFSMEPEADRAEQREEER